MKNTEKKMRKITVNLPADLLEFPGEKQTLTEILEDALKARKRRMLFAKLEAMRGKVDFGMTWQEMKYDRE